VSGSPRIAILGAGSVGCFIGGCWQAAGLPVHFIGRESFARDVREHGLTITDYSGWRASIPADEVDFASRPNGLGEADIVAVCVKSASTEGAARQIAEHGREGATVVSFQNGITNVDVLNQALGGRFDVVRGMVPYNVAYLGEGRLHKGVAGTLWAEDRPVLREIALTVQGPASLDFSDDMLGLAWGKLLINLNNAVNALSGRTLAGQLRERDYRRVVAAAMREGLEILHQARIPPGKAGPVPPRLLPYVIGSPDWLFNRLFLKLQKVDARARSSMADDLAAGRRTEVDYINGELVTLADRIGVDAPINRKIVDLVRRAEAGGEPWPPADLRHEVLGR